MASIAPFDLLFLTHRVPYPPDKGDRIRTYHMLRFLAERARVHLACLADEPVAGESVQELQRLCARVEIVPLGYSRWLHGIASLLRGRTVTEGVFQSSALRDTVRSWAQTTRFGAALASASSLVSYLQLPGLESVPAVVDLMDVDSQKWLDYAAMARGPRSWLYRIEGQRLRQMETGLPAQFRAVLLVSVAEAALYREFCKPGVVEAVGNGVDLDYFQPSADATEPACVFVGALDYRPNIDGIVWFCETVWPRIKRQRSDAVLYIVGRRPVRDVQDLARLPGVVVAGTVPDVRPYVRRSAVAVAPLRLARGLQNKVLEALAMGKATIAAPPALAALSVEPGVNVVSASSPSDWEAAVLQLLDDAALRQRLGDAGRRYVEQHHAWDKCLAPLPGLLGLQ